MSEKNTTMRLVITGSLGHIGRPLVEELVKQGHRVTVISSKTERAVQIENIGATAAIGPVEDADFLSATFAGADAVYCMEPPGALFDSTHDIAKITERQGKAYAEAIRRSGVKRVVHLSSIGAHSATGTGILAFHHRVEQLLGELPADVAIRFLRPVGFYYNLFAFIPGIRAHGKLFANYKADYKEPWVAPQDIAAVVAEEIVQAFEGRSFRYIASDELTSDELAAILGEAIGEADLKWVEIPDEQRLATLLGAGMSPVNAKGFTEMDAARRGGQLYEDYFRHRPATLGKTKLKAFAADFAKAFRNGQKGHS